MKIYVNIVDQINKAKYLLAGIPETYGPESNYFRDAETCGPIFVGLPGETGRGMYSIADMISMYSYGVPFEIVHDNDVLCIAVFTMQYVRYMEEFINPDQDYANDDASKYRKKLLNFQQVILRAAEKVRRKMMAADKISPEISKFANQVAYSWENRTVNANT
jgi:hypothetical protein